MNRKIFTSLMPAIAFGLITLFACSTSLKKSPESESSGAGYSENNTAQSQVMDLKTYLEKAEWDQGAVFEFPEPKKFTMSNGLQVFTVERRDIPMVYARAQIRGGSIYDPPEKNGLAYLTGWVLTEGTESYPDEVIDAAMDNHGAYVSSVAYNESCISDLTCLSEDIEELFPYFAEILSKAQFDQSALQEGKNYIIGDLMRMMDDPGEICYRRFRKEVFQDHPYAKQWKGTIEGIKNCTRQDVLDFYRRFYTPDHAVLVLVGDISFDKVHELCKKHLVTWAPSKEPLPPVPAPEAIRGRHIRLIDKDTVQAQIVLGHIGIDRVNEDRFKIQVMNRILGGGGLYTRLSTEVRVKRGLTYGIYSYFARREFTGEFVVATFTKADSCGETVRVIFDELNKIRSEPVSDEELEDAGQGLIGSFPLQYEKYEDIAEALVHMNFYGLPMKDITHYPTYVNDVTAQDVMDAARKHIHPDGMVITVVGPAEQIKPQLQSLGDVKIAPAI